MKELLSIIGKHIQLSQVQQINQEQTSEAKRRKVSSNTINDPYKIKQITLDLIDHVVSSHTDTKLQRIWLKWLYKHKDWSAVHQILIKSIFRWSSLQDMPDKYYDLFDCWWLDTSSTQRNRILGIPKLQSMVTWQQEPLSISRKHIKEIGLFWKLHMQQFASIFTQLQKKNPHFSYMSDNFISLWHDEFKQGIKFINALDRSQKFSIYFYIQILQTLAIFDQYITQSGITNSQQKFSALQKKVERNLKSIVEAYKGKRGKQNVVPFHLNQVVQNLRDVQEMISLLETIKQQLKDFDLVKAWEAKISIEKQLLALQKAYTLSIEQWLNEGSLTTVNQKYQQWQNIVSQTRLYQQSFTTYKDIEDKFTQLQEVKGTKALQKLKHFHPTIQFAFFPDADKHSFPLTPFMLDKNTFYIHYNFLLLLFSQYDWDKLILILSYCVQECLYINKITPRDQNIEREKLRAYAMFAYSTSWDKVPIKCSLLADIYQKWLKIFNSYQLLTQDEILILNRKIQLYRKLAFYLDNSRLDLNDITKTNITPGTNLSGITPIIIENILDSILDINTMA